MFHVNGTLPYLMPMVGARWCSPAGKRRQVDPRTVRRRKGDVLGLCRGVAMMLGPWSVRNLKLSTMKRTVIGGSACPPAMLDAFRESTASPSTTPEA